MITYLNIYFLPITPIVVLRLLFWTAGVISLYAKLDHNILLNNIAVPFFTLSLLFIYYLEKGKDNIFYFSFVFCLLGDIMEMSDDFSCFISGLMAYWGASILFSFALARELDQPITKAIHSFSAAWPFVLYFIYYLLLMIIIQPTLGDVFIPISIYALTLAYACALSIFVYIKKRTKAVGYFCLGLTLLSVAASLIGLNRFYFDHQDLFALETLFYIPTLYCIYLYFKHKQHAVP